MPELPEVETVCRTLAPLITGQRIGSFDLYWRRTLESPSVEEFSDRITGTRIAGVRRRAKLILLLLDDGGIITIHLRMTGELLYLPRSAGVLDPNRDRYLRATFGFVEGGELRFYDVRKFGRITFYSPEQLAALDRSLGIEPLDPSFTSGRLRELAQRRRQIKSLLLDQRVIAGLGNIYVDEALFAAGVHPLQPADTLDDARVERLHRAIVDILQRSIANHGTTLRDYRTGQGEPGRNQRSLRIYGLRAGTPCIVCATPIQRLVVGQRGTVFCPHCQQLPPTLDRRSQ
jgi:formamidopyrimidine-DNA glycosylase